MAIKRKVRLKKGSMEPLTNQLLTKERCWNCHHVAGDDPNDLKNCALMCKLHKRMTDKDHVCGEYKPIGTVKDEDVNTCGFCVSNVKSFWRGTHLCDSPQSAFYRRDVDEIPSKWCVNFKFDRMKG